MRSVVAPLALAAVGALAAKPTCDDGLHIIVARGSTEPEGTGLAGVLVEKAAKKIKGSKVVGLDYPATLTDYGDSEGDGADMLMKNVLAYNKACPDSKLALVGWSQGAQLIMDDLCGGEGGALFDDIRPISKDIIDKNVVAVVVFGDPSHTKDSPFNNGTSTKDGLFPRTDYSKCKSYTNKMLYYCDTGDRYCDEGKDADVHSSYFKKYQDDVINFIVDKYDAAAGKSGDGSGSTGTSSAASGSATGTSSRSGNSTASATSSGSGSATDPTGSSEPKPTGSASGTSAPSATPSGDNKGNAATGLSAYNGLYFAVPAALLSLSQLLL